MRRLLSCLSLPLAALVLAWSAPAARAGDLTVTVTGVTPADGDVRVILMDGRDHDMLQDHMRRLRANKAENGTLTAHFLGLTPGQYGVIAFREQSAHPGLDQTPLTMGSGPQTLTLPLAAN